MERLLIVQLGRLGDAVASRIALHSMAQALGPDAVELVVTGATAPLFRYEPWLPKIHVYPGDWGDWPAIVRFLLELRRRKPFVLLDATGSSRSRWLALLSGARERLGWGRAWLHHRGTPDRRREDANYSMEIARLVESCGVPARLDLPPLSAPTPPAGWKGRVVLHPGAVNPLRLWRGERFAQLARRLLAAGVDVGFVAGAAEGAWARELASLASVPLLIPESLPELMAALKAARLLIGLDSGPMHLAAALGTPVLALFGPNLPRRAAPVRGKLEFMETALECRPCRQVVAECVHPSNTCMDRLEELEVFHKTMDWLHASKS